MHAMRSRSAIIALTGAVLAACAGSPAPTPTGATANSPEPAQTVEATAEPTAEVGADPTSVPPATPGLQTPAEGVPELEVLIPDSFCGGSVLKSSRTSDHFANLGAPEAFLEMVRALGVDPAGTKWANGVDPSSGCSITFIRLPGAKGGSVERLWRDLLAMVGASYEEVSIGGRQLLRVWESDPAGEDEVNYVAFVGNTAIVIGARTDEQAAELLKLVP